MTYYFCVNSMINSGEQWQGYYSQIQSPYPLNDDFVNASLYTIAWAQNYIRRVNDSCQTLNLTMIPEDDKNITESKTVSSKKNKKKTQKSLEKEILSARKNSESNIINQFFSYFGSQQKSEKVVKSCCTLMSNNPEIYRTLLSLFYTSIRLINQKRGRKYVNVEMFLRFFDPEWMASYIPQIVNKLQSSKILTMEELCQIFRRCTKYFLKNISITALLTSKRISRVSKEQHMKKLRKFLQAILQT